MTGPGESRIPGAGALLTDVLASVSRLVRGEIALARAEIDQRISAAGRAAVQISVAAVLGITALNVFAGWAVALVISLGLSPAWAAVIVGGVLLVLALGIGQHAMQELRSAGSVPKHSATSLRRDVEILETMVKSDATT